MLFLSRGKTEIASIARNNHVFVLARQGGGNGTNHGLCSFFCLFFASDEVQNTQNQEYCFGQHAREKSGEEIFWLCCTSFRVTAAHTMDTYRVLQTAKSCLANTDNRFAQALLSCRAIGNFAQTGRPSSPFLLSCSEPAQTNGYSRYIAVTLDGAHSFLNFCCTSHAYWSGHTTTFQTLPALYQREI